MVKYILFMDNLRQEEIENFYKACQKHREYYKGYPKSYHPLTYFKDPEYLYQCPTEMSQVYLSFPPYHIKYKQPVVLPHNTGPTSGLPPLPDRCLAARYNRSPCKAFACQRHRDYYRGYARAHHPLLYFKDQEYLWQCPADLTPIYLGFPKYYVKYKQPAVLPSYTGRTSVLPALPERTLAGRFNKAACKAFVR